MRFFKTAFCRKRWPVKGLAANLRLAMPVPCPDAPQHAAVAERPGAGSIPPGVADRRAPGRNGNDDKAEAKHRQPYKLEYQRVEHGNLPR